MFTQPVLPLAALQSDQNYIGSSELSVFVSVCFWVTFEGFHLACQLLEEH